MAYKPDPKSASDEAVKKAARAVDELRKTIGLPSDPLAKEISAKIAAVAKERGVVVEWNIRVVRPGSPVEAVCNCTCYA
jgi:hypothetical protein